MSYTPELSARDSALLRRIAWAAGKPMTTTLTDVLRHIATRIDSAEVCRCCRDSSKCDTCVFAQSDENSLVA